MQYKLTVEELCMKLKPVFGKRMDDLYLKYAMAESDEERAEIEHILNALYHKHLAELLEKKVLLEPPEKEDVDGDYPLAVVSYADKKLFPFGLREKDWMRHVCISGMSGSGKTTLGFHIIKNFIDKGKPFLIFDWKKSFRPLMLIDNEIVCFTVGNENISNFFRMNINQPPEGVASKEWINVLCDLITESFFASYGVHKVLLETLDEAYKDLGVYNGSRNYPTWNEIKWRLENKLEKTKGRTATWLESALRIAHVLTFGNFGKTLNYKGKEVFGVEDLLKRKVLFELNSLGNVEKKFFCEFILTYIYKLKKARQAGINDKFDHAILVDEAHNIFLKDKTHFVNESVTDMVYREMREYGTSLICLDQHISKISDTVSGNSACLVAFQQQLPQDIETISGLMQLKDRRQYFSMLQVGTAIVKLSERYNLPFLVEVPDVELRRREISDYDVKSRMKAIFQGDKLEKGEDKKFMKELVQEEHVEEKKQETPRRPNHALYNGDIAKFKKFSTDFSRENGFQILEQMEDRSIHEVKPLVLSWKQEPVYEAAKEETVEEEEKPEETSFTIHESASELSDVQKILLEFVMKKLEKGWDTRKIERMLEEKAIEGNYSVTDVFIAINYALKDRFENAPKIFNEIIEQENVYKAPNINSFNSTAQNSSLSQSSSLSVSRAQKPLTGSETLQVATVNSEQANSSEENTEAEIQEKFISFLGENPSLELGTLELYTALGLSARKGNKIKNQLLQEGKIKIEEIRNSKGWKKIIRSKKRCATAP